MQVRKKMRKKFFSNLYGDLIFKKVEKPKFEIEDRVRILKYKRKIFDKDTLKLFRGIVCCRSDFNDKTCNL